MKKLELVEAVRSSLATERIVARVGVEFPWMSNRVPIEDGWSTPPRVLYRLSGLHARLGGDWERRKSKRERKLRFDLLVGDRTVVEIDTSEHFSSARLTSLDFYDSIDNSLDISTYESLCKEHRNNVDRRHRSRQTAEFPFPGGRLRQIAYFDFAKDVLAPAHGLNLVRLPCPENKLTPSVMLRIRVLL